MHRASHPFRLAASVLALYAATAAPAMAACSLVPSLMQAAVAPRAGGPEVLEIRQVPTPRPGADELLVRVHHAGVNPVDWKRQQARALPPPSIPGGDFSGVVVAAGANVAGFVCGDAVTGIAGARGRGGSYAEYVAVAVDDVVRRPANLSMAEAAGYPTVAVAAWRFAVAAARVRAGDRVLVHGGAGGVGSMVVQLAKARGAWVAATASARNHDFLRSLGADQVIDYTEVRFEDAVSDLDVVVDTVGGDTLARSPAVLRRGGRLVSAAGEVPAAACASGRIACPAEGPWDLQRALAELTPLVEAGRLKVHVERVFPLAQAADAQRHSQSGRARGKLVVSMDADRTAEVLVPLQAYIDGHATGLEARFRRAFADDGWLHGIKDGQVRRWPAQDYIAASSSGRAPADESRRRRAIRQVTVTGDVATAVIELDYPDMKALDHMVLLRRDDEWRIVLKAYDARTPTD